MPRFDDAAVQGLLNARRVIGHAPFPGSPDIKIGFRILSDREIDIARFQSQMYLDSECKRKDITTTEFAIIEPELLSREQQRQTLLAAVVDVESPSEAPHKFFGTIEQVRGLDSVLVAQLWELYSDFLATVHPRLSLTDMEVAELAASLKVEPLASTILAAFERDTLTSLLRFMASQLVISTDGKSSTSDTSTKE